MTICGAEQLWVQFSTASRSLDNNCLQVAYHKIGVLNHSCFSVSVVVVVDSLFTLVTILLYGRFFPAMSVFINLSSLFLLKVEIASL